MNHLKLVVLSVAFPFIATSCSATKTAAYDPYTYQKTTELKVESTKLMDKSTSPYSNHKEEVKALLLEIGKLKEYEKNKLNNEITFTLWEALTDEEKNLLSGFFKQWEEKITLSPFFLKESKKQISEVFDLLIQYEIKKDKVSKENLLDQINSYK